MVRALPTLVVAVVLGALAPRTYAAQDLPRQIGMYTQQGAPLAMVDSDIAVRAVGPIAAATVTQVFRNDTDNVAEATYVFPLPPDAVVSGLQIRTGNRTIEGKLDTRAHAEQRYEAAVAAGLSAGLLEQERPDVFTQTVSAIPAHGTVSIVLRFDTVAKYAHGTWELVLPLTVAPRYVPGSASGRPTTGTGRAPDTDRAPDASRVTPAGTPGGGGRTDVTIELADAADVTSPTHELAANGTTYTLADPTSDHDVVIRWRSTSTQRAWVERGDRGNVAAVLVEAKPAPARSARELRVRLVLDRAATTKGDAGGVEQAVVRALLDALGSKDTVAVSGSDTLAFAAPAAARKAIDARWAAPAVAFDLTQTLRALDPKAGTIVLVTDGLIADDAAALQAAGKLGVPIHVIGIGPAPNRGLLDRIALATGGTVRYALVGDDYTALARDVIADVASPPLPVSITWGTLHASDVVPSKLPRIGAGQALLALARVTSVSAANARARGDVFAFTEVAGSQVLSRRWAKQKLDELVASGAPDDVIEHHALAYDLVSPVTSMVAIGMETVIEGGVKHTIPVPVSVPAGMQWQLVQKQTTVSVTSSLRDEGGEAGEAEDEDLESRAPAPADVIASESVRGSLRAYRLALALGGGVAIAGGESAPLASLSARFEYGRHRVLGGIEGSLSLVDGLHGQGGVLAIASIEHAHLALGAGGGVRITGDAAGPAFDLVLRYSPSLVRGFAGFLRYDGALLDGTTQHAISGGIETRW
jgi:Ca-activated chloride channel family protein